MSTVPPPQAAAEPHDPAELLERALAEGVARADLPTTLPDADRRLRLEGGLNFRDVGGYVGLGGRRVRRSMVFRSDHLNELTDADRDTIAALGLRVVHDFRLAQERERQPSRMHAGPEVQLLSTADLDGIDTTMMDVIRDMIAGLRPMPAADFWVDNYVTLVANGRSMFVELHRSLAAGDRLPAMYHCTGGKDRTGIATALLLTMLGVDRATIVDDFLCTNLYRTPARVRALRAGMAAVGVDVVAAIPVLGVTRDAIERALEVIDAEYGGPERYLVDGGLPADAPDRLRTLLLA